MFPLKNNKLTFSIKNISQCCIKLIQIRLLMLFGMVRYRNNMMYLYKKNNEKCFQQKLYHNVFILVEC
ncbi:hypothetical protein Hdeb2414_s0015g00437481 [Helianthus debilis subsp. tardiflorus]